MKKAAAIFAASSSIATGQYDVNFAKQITYLAGAGYCDVSQLSDWSCMACGMTGLPIATNEVVTLSDALTGNSGAVAKNSQTGELYVTYAGSRNIQDWIENINITKIAYPACSGCQVHSGFYFAYSVLSGQLLQGLDLLGAKTAPGILSTGHSLGAAMAQITGLEASLLGLPFTTLMNFGQPRVGNPAYAAFSTKMLAPGNLAAVGNPATSGLAAWAPQLFDGAAVRRAHATLRSGRLLELPEGGARSPLTVRDQVQALLEHGYLLPISHVLARAVAVALAKRSDVSEAQAAHIANAMEEQAGLTQSAGAMFLASEEAGQRSRTLPSGSASESAEEALAQVQELQKLSTTSGIASLEEEHLALLDSLDLASNALTSVTASTYRHVHYKDLVAHVPPELFGFEHSPQEMFFDEAQDSYIVCSAVNGESPNCSDQFLLPDSISDHLNYLNITLSNLC